MSRQITTLLFLVVMVLFRSLPACATHTFGGELLYEHLTGNRYLITLTIYGDCSGETFARLYSANPIIEIYDGKNFHKDTKLFSTEQSGKEVSPVCPDEINNTNCKGGALPGVVQFIYEDTIDLPYASANWRITFPGDMGNSSQAGRSHSITNVTGSSVMYLEAGLNNIVGQNSSPKYNTIPTPFYCINIPQQYNQGATDGDNDSLAFLMTPALTTGGVQTGYINGYTPTRPMSTTNFSYNSLNGQMSFLPNLVQKSVIVNRVDEYRNGQIVGYSMREMTMIILDNCNNNPPIASLDSTRINQGIHVGNNVVNVCEGNHEVSFRMPITDADGDTIDATVTNVPPGAILNIADNHTKQPFLEFRWNVKDVVPGNYNLFLNLKDNNCPLSANQTIAYTLQVVKPAAASHTVTNPTRCLYDAQVRIDFIEGTTPREITLWQNGQVLKTYVDTVGYITDKLGKGDYHVTIRSPKLLCNSEYDFSIVDSGSYPYAPAFTSPHYCIDDSVEPIIITPGRFGDIIWRDMEGNELDEAPVISTSQPGVYRWMVSELYEVCESRRDTFEVFVHEQPLCEITTIPEHVCTGDKIYLTGSDETLDYEWLPSELVNMERDGSIYTRVMVPTTYYAIATDQYGCKDTADITFNDVEPCCKFSYPTAFTPNGDGKNDGFRAIFYGNEESYDLAIYNRWGQEVFRTNNPKEYWNGSFGGKACEMGTYYYMVRGKCMTGTSETHKGEFILIR